MFRAISRYPDSVNGSRVPEQQAVITITEGLGWGGGLSPKFAEQGNFSTLSNGKFMWA